MNNSMCDDETKTKKSLLSLPFEVVTVRRGGLNMKGVVATERIPAGNVFFFLISLPLLLSLFFFRYLFVFVWR